MIAGNYAVRLWQNAPANPQSIPFGWPESYRFLGAGTTLPSDGTSWQLMTDVTLGSQISSNQSAYNTWFTSYQLAQAISQKIASFKAALNTYSLVAYTTDGVTDFLTMYSQAKSAVRVNQAAYIQPLFNWRQSLITYSSTYTAAVSAMTDLSTVQASVWDIPGNTNTVPSITLAGALAITT